MITVKLSGGLGNQFFQYAAALSLQKKRGKNEQITIEYQSKTHESHAERELALSKFKLDDSIDITVNSKNYFDLHPIKSILYKIINRVFFGLGEKRNICKIEWYLNNLLGIYSQKYNKFYPFKKSFFKNIYVTGMFHTSYYFCNYEKILKKQFVLKQEYYNDVLNKRLEKLNNSSSVCVHVRRGDYLNVDGYSICSSDYFSKGMQYIRANVETPVFYVFSDDIQWCKENIVGKDVVYFNDKNPDYIDFELMRNCKHYIISNSTFSWWAAYLGNYEDKIVITPNYWSKSSPRDWLTLKEWIAISPN